MHGWRRTERRMGQGPTCRGQQTNDRSPVAMLHLDGVRKSRPLCGSTTAHTIRYQTRWVQVETASNRLQNSIDMHSINAQAIHALKQGFTTRRWRKTAEEPPHPHKKVTVQPAVGVDGRGLAAIARGSPAPHRIMLNTAQKGQKDMRWSRLIMRHIAHIDRVMMLGVT